VDLGWTEHLLEEGAYHLACFLSQQVAEKALKAYLYAQGEDPVTGHSVRRLGQRCGEYDASLGAAAAQWSILDSFYIPTRYPNGLPDDIPANVYDADTASRAATLAARAVEEVAGRLGVASDAAREEGGER
jgi:HEPN domain-containing protein